MLASNSTIRPPIEAVDFARFGGIVGIPPESTERFAAWLRTRIESEWNRAAEPREVAASWSWRRAKIDADLTKAGRAFIRAIEQKDTLSTEGTDLPDWMMIKSVNEYLRRAKPPKRGAPKRADRFAEFVERLLYVIRISGGDASANRKTGKGRVFGLLEELRPIMPPRFIPKALPLSKIERSCTWGRALECAVASHMRPECPGQPDRTATADCPQ